MKSKTLIRRYSLGLIQSIQDQREYESVFSELKNFTDFLYSQEELKKVLLSPFIPAAKKLPVLENVLKKQSWSQKVSRYLKLLTKNNRVEILPSVLELLPQLWNEMKGVSTFEIFSAVALNEEQKKRLKERLQRLENNEVVLKYKIDPNLIGGLRLKKDHTIWDVSLKGDLYRIKEKICER